MTSFSPCCTLLPSGSRLPLLSGKPAVTFPAAEHHRPLANTTLYCLVTEAHRCEQLAQGCYAAFARVGFEPTTCWSQVQRSTRCATAPRHRAGKKSRKNRDKASSETDLMSQSNSSLQSAEPNSVVHACPMVNLWKRSMSNTLHTHTQWQHLIDMAAGHNDITHCESNKRFTTHCVNNNTLSVQLDFQQRVSSETYCQVSRRKSCEYQSASIWQSNGKSSDNFMPQTAGVWRPFSAQIWKRRKAVVESYPYI